MKDKIVKIEKIELDALQVKAESHKEWSIVLSAVVGDNEGLAVEGQEVAFKMMGKKVAVATTDEFGSATTEPVIIEYGNGLDRAVFTAKVAGQTYKTELEVNVPEPLEDEEQLRKERLAVKERAAKRKKEEEEQKISDYCREVFRGLAGCFLKIGREQLSAYKSQLERVDGRVKRLRTEIAALRTKRQWKIEQFVKDQEKRLAKERDLKEAFSDKRNILIKERQELLGKRPQLITRLQDLKNNTGRRTAYFLLGAGFLIFSCWVIISWGWWLILGIPLLLVVGVVVVAAIVNIFDNSKKKIKGLEQEVKHASHAIEKNEAEIKSLETRIESKKKKISELKKKQGPDLEQVRIREQEEAEEERERLTKAKEAAKKEIADLEALVARYTRICSDLDKKKTKWLQRAGSDLPLRFWQEWEKEFMKMQKVFPEETYQFELDYTNKLRGIRNKILSESVKADKQQKSAEKGRPPVRTIQRIFKKFAVMCYDLAQADKKNDLWQERVIRATYWLQRSGLSTSGAYWLEWEEDFKEFRKSHSRKARQFVLDHSENLGRIRECFKLPI